MCIRDRLTTHACDLSLQKATCTVDNLVPVVNGLEFILAFGIQKLHEDCAPAVAPPRIKIKHGSQTHVMCVYFEQGADGLETLSQTKS